MTNDTIVASALQVHGRLTEREIDRLHDRWAKLDQRLRSFEGRHVTIDLYVHDRDTASQRVVVETVIGGFDRFVATDASDDLAVSLNRVRDETIRQITDAKNKAEPRNNRRLRRR